MSFVDTRLASRASPLAARSLFTVRGDLFSDRLASPPTLLAIHRRRTSDMDCGNQALPSPACRLGRRLMLVACDEPVFCDLERAVGVVRADVRRLVNHHGGAVTVLEFLFARGARDHRCLFQWQGHASNVEPHCHTKEDLGIGQLRVSRIFTGSNAPFAARSEHTSRFPLSPQIRLVVNFCWLVSRG